MAKSIKLSGDNYWDTSGLYGGQIFNALSNITSGQSKALTVPNSFRGILFIFLSSATAMGVYTVYSTSTGAITLCPINAVTSNVTLTTATNRLTINNGAGGSIFPYYIGNNILS